MFSLFADLAAWLAGPNAPDGTRRRIQRMLGVAAMVLMINLLGPLFGYDIMAILGALVMMLAAPSKKEA